MHESLIEVRTGDEILLFATSGARGAEMQPVGVASEALGGGCVAHLFLL